MSGDTAVDPQSALSAAAQLTAAGEAMLASWMRLRGKIDDLNGQQAWGADDVGKQFNEHYMLGKPPPAPNVLDVGEGLIRAVAALGGQVTEGVRGVVDIDELTAQWFGEK